MLGQIHDGNSYGTSAHLFRAPYGEETAGYCRAMRVGNQIFVSGTAPPPVNVRQPFAPGDALCPDHGAALRHYSGGRWKL